jgi:hypothetical protein
MLCASLLIPILLSGCSDSTTEPEVPVADDPSGLLTSKLSISVVSGGEESFTVTATDDNGNPAEFTAISGDPAIGQLSVAGNQLTVVGGLLGATTIAVTSAHGTRQVPVQVYDPMVLEYDGLLITYVDRFTYLYNDSGTDADMDGSFWHPITEDGFYPLGSVIRPDHGNPNENTAVIVAKMSDPAKEALAAPLSYERIWTDSNSDGDNDGSTWRPIAPPGYVAMGVVCQAGYAEPSLDAVRCVRANLTVPGKAGTVGWIDAGSGATQNFGAWQVDIPVGAAPADGAHLKAGTFVGTNQWSPPTGDSMMNVLKIRFPMLAEGNPQVYLPKLRSLAQPPATTDQMLGKAMLVPFTAVNEPIHDLHWQVTNSPFYRAERKVYFKRKFWNYNDTTVLQPNSFTYTSGVTDTESETFHVTTGLSITSEGSVSFLGTGGSVSVEVSVEFGYATTNERAVLDQNEFTTALNLAPGKAGAIWQRTTSFSVMRHAGTNLQVLGAAWEIGEDSYVTSDYSAN